MELTQIILQNEGLIYSVARYFNNYIDMEDLYQAGCKGIIEAYNNYDSTKAKFSTYAYSYILGEMKALVRTNQPLKVSRDILSLKTKIEKVETMLTQKLMHKPTIVEISEYLDIEENIIIEAINSNTTVKSIDQNIYNDINMYEIIGGKTIDLDTLLYLKSEFENLNEPDRSIMIQRYYGDLTQMEVANNLGLSQVNVSRREQKVLQKIRQGIN